MASSRKRPKMSEDTPSCSTFEKKRKNPQHFDPRTSYFDDVVKKDDLVDKSLLIKTIFNNNASGILITAPRRFGKSTNMDMVKKFFEIQVDENGVVIDREKSSNRQIFEDNNLLIFQDKEFFDQHFATYPVIHVDFKDIFGSEGHPKTPTDNPSFEQSCEINFAKVLDDIRKVLHITFTEHEYLLKSDKLNSDEKEDFETFSSRKSYKNLTVTDIEWGLEFLSKCLYKHFDKKKVFVLIDEYDAPINNTMFEEKIKMKQINNLFTSIFSKTLKGNKYVERALLTGISYFASVELSEVNNVVKYMFLGEHDFVRYYGLIESEVDALLSKFKIDGKKKDDVKSFYNGYYSRNNVKLFSLWSVLNYLQTNELQSYWEKSGLVCGLQGALHIPIIQFAIEKLLQGDYPRNIEIIEYIELEHVTALREILLGRTDKKVCNPDLFLNFLLQEGYLTYKSINVLTIPNNEIRKEFKRELTDYIGESRNRVLDECATAFDQISISDTSSFQKFVEKFQAFVNTTSADIIKENERVFHSLLFCVICRSQIQVCDYVEFSGNRYRPDLIVAKVKNGFMIDIRFKQDSKKALQQIIEKKYYTKFDREEFKNLEHKLYLGVNVSEDFDVSLAVLVNTLDINKAEFFSP